MPDGTVERAVAAAVAVAGGLGLRAEGAVPVGTGSNVVVHLRPAPVVARVMTGTVVLHGDPRAWLARELAVGAFLGERGAPVVAPTTLVAPGPYTHGGVWLSLWDHVEVVPARLGGEELGRSLRELHDALAAFPGALPPRSDLLGEIDWLLAALPDAGDLAAERDRLAGVITAPEDDAQPIHGDASLSNLLVTPDGPRWNDLEDVCRGSPAWDLVGLMDDARDRRGAAVADAVAAGYGGAVARPAGISAVQALYGELWRRYHWAPRRAP